MTRVLNPVPWLTDLLHFRSPARASHRPVTRAWSAEWRRQTYPRDTACQVRDTVLVSCTGTRLCIISVRKLGWFETLTINFSVK